MMLNLDDYRKLGASARLQLQAELKTLRPFSEEINSLANAEALADANIQLLLPQLSAEQRSAVFEELCWQQRMAQSDQHALELIEHTQIIDANGVLASTQPRIFCTFHLGSYRLLFQAFARAGKDVALFVSGNTLKRQGESFFSDASLAKERGWTGTFQSIDATSDQCVLQGLRALRRGKSLVLYIDGNTGAGTQAAAEMSSVSFFQQPLLARTGIAAMAQLGGVSIIPVACRREADMLPVLEFLPEMQAGAKRDAARAAEVTQDLYGILETLIRARPGHWEGWLYVHRWLRPVAAAASLDAAQESVPEVSGAEEARWELDAGRFSLLNYPGQSVLLDRQTRQCTSVNASCVTQLARLAAGLPPWETAGDPTAKPAFSELVRLGVVNPVSPARPRLPLSCG